MNICLRMLSICILLPVIILLITLNNIIIKFLVIIIILLSLYEFYMMITANRKMIVLFLIYGFLYVYFLIFFNIDDYALIMISCFIFGFIFLINPDLNRNELEKITMLFFGFFYIVYGLQSIIYLCDFSNGIVIGIDFLFLLLIITWSNDIFAYIFGSFFGKNKLCKKVSSKKTLEGFIAGAFFCFLIPFFIIFLFHLLDINNLSSIKYSDIMIISLIASIISPIGDLIESRLKRAYCIKDSGSMIPGHGGILDRIDSLLFMAPITLFYVNL